MTLRKRSYTLVAAGGAGTSVATQTVYSPSNGGSKLVAVAVDYSPAAAGTEFSITDANTFALLDVTGNTDIPLSILSGAPVIGIDGAAIVDAVGVPYPSVDPLVLDVATANNNDTLYVDLYFE